MFSPFPPFEHFSADQWPRIEPWFNELRDASLDGNDLPAWLEQWSRLSALLSEWAAWLYIEMSRHTGDGAREAAYLQFTGAVSPRVQEAEQVLKEKLLAADPRVPGLGPALRLMQSEAALFRQANLARFSRDAELVAAHGRIEGEQSVEFEGEARPLPAMNVYLESPDRALRERAWRLAWERRGCDAGALDALFDEMLALRSAIAREAGFDSYTDYRFRQLGRFDYTPQDCLDFHAAIEKEVVPLASRLLELRRGALGLEKLRPWDLEVDPFAGQPLKPFETADQLASGVENMVARVDARLAPFFQVMRRRGWMDLMSRTGKRAGGFCSALHCSQGSFILMNASGRADDVYTLLHESGHAFHNFLSSRAQPLFFARETPIEFAETASMSMELLGSAHLDVFFSPRDAAQVLLGQLEKIVLFLPYMSTIDLFQHWVYANPQASHAERHAKYLELHRRFLPGVDYSGLDAVRQAIWHQKLHIFCVPFYYVEYGMAQLGALQVWKNSLADPQEATRAYLEALALGGTRTLPELFSAAGARFSFDARTLGSLMALCREKIEALSAHLAADKVKGKL